MQKERDKKNEATNLALEVGRQLEEPVDAADVDLGAVFVHRQVLQPLAARLDERGHRRGADAAHHWPRPPTGAPAQQQRQQQPRGPGGVATLHRVTCPHWGCSGGGGWGRGRGGAKGWGGRGGVSAPTVLLFSLSKRVRRPPTNS